MNTLVRRSLTPKITDLYQFTLPEGGRKFPTDEVSTGENKVSIILTETLSTGFIEP